MSRALGSWRRASGALSWRFSGGTPQGSHCLAYHLVRAGTDCLVDISEGHFKEQLRGLAGARTLDSLLGSEDGLGEPAGPGPVVTFDDAFANFPRVAWPLLEEASIPVTLYVPTGFVAGDHPAPLRGAENQEPASWAELRELAASELVTIGSHSHSHRDLPSLSDAELEDELARSKGILEDRLGFEVRHFCCPRGRWDRRVEEAVFRHYDTSAVAGGRRNRPGLAPRRIYRVPIRRDSPTSLEPILRSRVWLEEWISDLWRNRLYGGL